jgi:exonuclease III
MGDYEGAAWNAQGYFMAKVAGHAAKRHYAQRLLLRRDFLVLSETHVTEGTKRAYTDLPGTVSWWSSGTAARAGVGIILKKTFLAKFSSQLPLWTEMEPGRLASLQLAGPDGALDIVACYMPTGVARTLRSEAELACPSTPHHPEAPPEMLRAQREALCRRLPAALRPGRALAILAGDFNFVTSVQDRWNKSSGEFTGGNDLAEAAHWRRVLPQALLYELYQPEPTHEGPRSLAKLDRVFTNQSIADQLDKRVFATALPWTELSQHRPLAFGRQTRPTRPPMSKPIQEEILRDARWPMWVAAEFHSLQEMTPEEQNPIVRLRQLKTAIRVSAARLAEERASTYSSSAPTSHLGITMAALRRLERRGLPDLPVLCSRYPLLRSILTPDLLQHAPHLCLSRLRDHAVALAREEVHASLQRLHEDLPHLDDEARTRRRSQVLLQIKKVAPGRSAALAAIMDSEGELRTDGPGMASALRHHWKDTFAARRLDRSRRLAWFRTDAADRQGLHAAVQPLLVDGEAWRVRRSDVRRAVSMAGSSSPGPDGIPYSAWRLLGPLAIDVLHGALTELSAEQGQESLLAAFPGDADGNTAFNEATMVFIPKKVSREAQGIRYNEPGDARPLSIVNTDNRLMANAVRLRVEPLLAKAVSPAQRGFLPGRSMLQNVFEIDGEMRAASLQAEFPAAVFFDFAAAFPSLAHDLLRDVLDHLQLPRQFRAFVANLYLGNGCRIAAAGDNHDGFSVRSGIRQGCPLSPLLFALCGDLLLRRLQHLLPDDLCRAYADDIGFVAKDLFASAEIFVPIFEEFAEISGLSLNLGKTVFVPLGDTSVEEFRRELEERFAGWGAAGVRGWADYLGFTLGPDSRDRSWRKALIQYSSRADLWAQLGLGLHYTSVAYNVYIASLLGFLLQLEVLPEEWESVEAAALRRLVPGPAKWVLPADLHALRTHHGLPHEFSDMEEVSFAARFRVAHKEASASGGLAVPSKVRRLNAHYAASVFLARCGRWRWWYQHSYYHNLEAAIQHGRHCGITLSSVEDELGATAPRPHTKAQAKKLQHGVQRAARAALGRVRRSDPEARLHKKLLRWRLPLFPRIRAMRATRVMSRLRSLVPPRVLAAVLRTWFNGWCTKRRFQSSGECLFGCSLGEDSVDHYMSCSRLHSYGCTRLRLSQGRTFADRGLSFMLLDATASLTDAVLTRRALLVAAAYRLHCRHRRSEGFREDAVLSRALDQAVKEAALGHRTAMKCYDSIWVQNTTSSSSSHDAASFSFA